MMAETQATWKTWRRLQMLIYACIFIKVTKPHIANPLLYAAKQARWNKFRYRLKVRRISLNMLYHKLRAGKVNVCEPDANAVVCISEKNAVYLGLRTGQWLMALFHVGHPVVDNDSKDTSETVHRRWIMISVCPDLQEDCCLISSLLYHNLQQVNYNQEIVIEFDNRVLLSRHMTRILTLWANSHCKIIFDDSSTGKYLPDTASEVHIQVVESTKYRCGNELESVIKDYFRVTKIVSVGDTLLVPVPSHLGYEFVPSNAIIPPKYIFIKVISVKGKSNAQTKECVFVSVDATKLYLTGTTHCLLPLLTENFDEQGNVNVPPILKKTLDKVKGVLQMEMQEKIHESKTYKTIPENNDSTTYMVDKRMSDDISASEDSTSKPLVQHLKGQKNKGVDIKQERNCAATVTVLLVGPPGCGNEQVIKFAASALGVGVLWINCWNLKGDTSGGTETRLRQTFLRASSQGPCVLALLNVQCLAKDRDGGEDARVVAALREEVEKLAELEPHVFLIATVPDRTRVSDDLWSVWSYQESVELPDLKQRTVMFEWLFSHWLPALQTHSLAQRTAGFVLGDFKALVNAARRNYVYRMTAQELKDTEESRGVDNKQDPPLFYTDLLKALDELQANRSEALGAPHIPQVRWGEVGGLEEAKRQIVNTIQLPLSHPSLVSSRLRRSGVLMYGPPGTGKTLLAKAVATECGLNFLSVKGPELLNMYVGQSEENVRQVFVRARAAAPCVIFFDELDSLAPNRGRSGDSGGVMDRIVSALLAELDGVASSSDVFVLAATNRPDLIDPALLRPGRFEKLVFLGVCDDRRGQVKILKAVTSKIPLGSNVSLERIAESLPLTLTGADLYAVCTDALYTALYRTTSQIKDGVVREEDASIVVEEVDFETAAKKLVPSVTPRELAYYQSFITTSDR